MIKYLTLALLLASCNKEIITLKPQSKSSLEIKLSDKSIVFNEAVATFKTYPNQTWVDFTVDAKNATQSLNLTVQWVDDSYTVFCGTSTDPEIWVTFKDGAKTYRAIAYNGHISNNFGGKVTVDFDATLVELKSKELLYITSGKGVGLSVINK